MKTTRLDYVKHTDVDEFPDYNSHHHCKAHIVPLNRRVWKKWETGDLSFRVQLMSGIKADLVHRGIIGPNQGIIFCSPAGFIPES